MLEQRIEEVNKANHAFYAAFGNLDIGEMDMIWAHQDYVTCIHPGWSLRSGWPSVRDSWVLIFNNTFSMTFELTDVTVQVAGDLAWDSIPTCKSQGIDVDYLMLRGFFMPGGATKDEVAYYVDLMKKVRDEPEWKSLMNDGAFNQTFMSGDEYTKWVADAEKRHVDLMKSAGFLAAN